MFEINEQLPVLVVVVVSALLQLSQGLALSWSLELPFSLFTWTLKMTFSHPCNLKMRIPIEKLAYKHVSYSYLKKNE